MSSDSVLVVDDEKSWRDIYEAAARKVGISTVRAASTLDDALAEIEARKFSVAVVDIGLDEADDTNVDGLAVLGKIRSVGDDTSVLVVTGRAGQDVISIVSDALKKYGAQDTMAKSIIEPRILRQAIELGLDSYHKSFRGTYLSRYSVLRGSSDQMIWDDQMMRILGLDAQKLYSFIEDLMGPFMPLVQSVSGASLGSHPRGEVTHGTFWSRAIGAAVVVLMGREPKVNDVISDAKDVVEFLVFMTPQKLSRLIARVELKGVVLRLSDGLRSDFARDE